MQLPVGGDVRGPGGAHLVLRSIPRLLHRRPLRNHLARVAYRILPALIRLVATHGHIIVPADLLVDAVGELLRLVDGVRLLHVAAALAVAHETAAAG